MTDLTERLKRLRDARNIAGPHDYRATAAEAIERIESLEGALREIIGLADHHDLISAQNIADAALSPSTGEQEGKTLGETSAFYDRKAMPPDEWADGLSEPDRSWQYDASQREPDDGLSEGVDRRGREAPVRSGPLAESVCQCDVNDDCPIHGLSEGAEGRKAEVTGRGPGALPGPLAESEGSGLSKGADAEAVREFVHASLTESECPTCKGAHPNRCRDPYHSKGSE